MHSSSDLADAWARARARSQELSDEDIAELWNRALDRADTELARELLGRDDPYPDGVTALLPGGTWLSGAWARRADTPLSDVTALLEHTWLDLVWHSAVERATHRDELAALERVLQHHETCATSDINLYSRVALLSRLRAIDNPVHDGQPNLGNTPQKPDTPDSSDTTDTPDTPDTPDTSDTSDTSGVSDPFARRLLVTIAARWQQHGWPSAGTLAELIGTHRNDWHAALHAGDNPNIAVAAERAGMLADDRLHEATIALLERAAGHFPSPATTGTSNDTSPVSDETPEGETSRVAAALTANLRLSADHARRLAVVVDAISAGARPWRDRDRLTRMADTLRHAADIDRSRLLTTVATGDCDDAHDAWRTLTRIADGISTSRHVLAEAAAGNPNLPLDSRRHALNWLASSGGRDQVTNLLTAECRAGRIDVAAELLDEVATSHGGWRSDLVTALDHAGWLDPLVEQLGPKLWLLDAPAYSARRERLADHLVSDLVAARGDIAADAWNWTVDGLTAEQRAVTWALAANWTGTPRQLRACATAIDNPPRRATP